jgi:acyl-coenzyme A synthetase/AMP-(fatty) acid ligase
VSDEFGSLWDLIERRAAETPDRQTAVDERGEALTFEALRHRAERVAAGLAERHGIGEGDVVSWQLPTWIESMVLVGALARLQAVQNPILPLYREREVGFIVPQAKTKLFLTPSEWRGFDYEAMVRAIADASGGVEVLVADRSLPEGDPSALPPPPASTTPEDAPVRWLFYTSGTTAEPKGVVHSHDSLIAELVNNPTPPLIDETVTLQPSSLPRVDRRPRALPRPARRTAPVLARWRR